MQATPIRPDRAGAIFENLVDLSIQRYCYCPPTPKVGARILKGKWIPHKMPFDRMMTHKATGRSITFDAKSCKDLNRLVLGKSHLPEHQRTNLIAAGEQGVISGILAEASHLDLSMVFWLPWHALITSPPSVAWDDHRMLSIGANDELIDFDRLVELAVPANVIPQ